MVPLRRFTPVLAVSLLLFLTACLDNSGPNNPVGVDLTPSMSHVTTDNPDLGAEDNGLFFFRPPMDEDEVPQGFLDADVQPILSIELCNVEGLLSFNEFTSVCPEERRVALIDDTNPVFGQTLGIQSAGSFDFYSAVLKLNQLDPAVGELHVIRVMIGSPETEGAFFVPGYVPAVFTDDASSADSDADPPIYRVGDLPVKFYLSDLATRQLVCGDVDSECTYEVWDLNANVQDICHPVNDCLGSEALAGLRMADAALQEVSEIIGADEILVVCSAIDPEQNPYPLGVALPQVPVFVDCGFTPSFGTLAENVFDVQLCIPSGIADHDGFVAGHLAASGIVEFLLKTFNPFIFDDDNCDSLPQLAANSGLFDKIRFAALNGVVRPLARALGPQPLAAWDGSTWSSRSSSPFAAILRPDVLPNQGPDPFEVAGTTVPVSVCVGIQHLDPSVPPGPDNQIDILFEATGGGSIEGGATKTVTTALREKTADDECTVSDDNGQIAVAEVDWTLSTGVGLNELTASVPGDFEQILLEGDGTPANESVELSYTFSTQTVELLGACTAYPEADAAYDELGQRGFYILPSEFGIVGDDLAMVQIRVSSGNGNGKGLAGTYRVSLSARDASYDPGNTIETVEKTFTLSGDAPENQTVTFAFSQLSNLGATPIAFVANLEDAPRKNARAWYRVPAIESISGFPQLGDPLCTGAIVTNGTTYTTPLDTDRRQGMDITLLGVDKP